MNWQPPSVRIDDRAAIIAFAEGLQKIRETAFQPPEEVDGLDWVETHCSFSRETTGHDDAVELYGYQRGIIKVMTDGLHDKVVIPKSTRSGITQCASFAAAFFIAHMRTQVAFVQPTEAKAKDWEKTYWEPMMRDINPLAAVKRYPRKGEVQDTWALKFMSNGSVFRCYSAEAPDNFTSYTGQVQIGDELDRDGWASGGVRSQGTKMRLFEERSRTFPRRKTIYMSSPRRKGSSRIWAEWEKSDKRHYEVPCPHCSGMQYLKLGSDKTKYGLKWEVNEDGHVTSVAYQCEHCHELIDESHKRWMDANGDWKPRAVPARPGIAGFHVNMLMSLFSGAGWATIAQEWLAAQSNPEDLETAVNNLLGEPWDEVEGVAIEPEGLALRAVSLPAEVPDWVGLLTCGMDCQSGSEDQDKHDAKPPRVEAQVIGWGPEGRFIPIAYRVFDEHYPFSAESEAQLDEFRRRPWSKRDGNVEAEVHAAAAFLVATSRPWCRTHQVESNHDDALSRWLDDPRAAEDEENAYYWSELKGAWLRAIRSRDETFNPVRHAMSAVPEYAETVDFVGYGQGLVIADVECGLHGDVGISGSRGSPNQFHRLGEKVVSAHTHSPLVREGVYVAGVSARLSQGYNDKGPGAWAHAHVVIYKSGKRALLAMSTDGRAWAEGADPAAAAMAA